MVRSDQSKSYLSELLKLTKYKLVSNGYQKLTVAGTAVSLTIPADSRYALMVVDSTIATPAIRYLLQGDKTLPTATDGLQKLTAAEIEIEGYQNLINFRAIQVGAGTHVLHIQYFK